MQSPLGGTITSHVSVLRTTGHYMRHAESKNRLVSKGMIKLLEDGARIKTLTLLRELHTKLEASPGKEWEGREEWDNEWKL